MRKSHLGLQQPGVRGVRRVSRRFTLEMLERRELLASNLFIVNANTDSGTGSGNTGDLRYAITQVNLDPKTNNDVINFAIGGSATIALASALPSITTPVFINGLSEGATTGVPLISLDATKVAANASAIEIDAGHSEVSGLSIINSPGAAISLVGNGKGLGDGNTIVGSFIGTADGTTAAGNAVGIQVIGSSGNTIGGNVGLQNVISGNNGPGISIADPTNGQPSNNNRILDNYIGVDTTGATALANNGDGIYIDHSSGDTIDGNTISGNSGEGLRLDDSKGICSLVTITNNMIGTSADGTQGIGNGRRGIYISSGSQITIGGVNEGNVVSESGQFAVNQQWSGIRLDAGGGPSTTGVVIEGNKIGTDITGTVKLSNGYDGIRLLGADNTTIGGLAQGAGNLISGNWVDNVSLDTLGGSPNNLNTLIVGNLIGLNASGSQVLGDVQRGRYGIYQNGANFTTIGGLAPGARNVISGNVSDGIYLGPGGNTLIQGNDIGTDLTGTKPVGNRGNGVMLAQGNNVTITNNVIAGNAGSGIGSLNSGTTSGNVTIQGNSIGTTTGSLVAGVNTKSSFDGMGFNDSGGFVPPDTIAAVGQKYVVETINTTIRITNKNGGVILDEPLTTFFPQSQYGLFDPVVFYDDNSGRFVVAAMEVQTQTDLFGFTTETSNSFINIAFSDPGNEGSFSSKYRLTTTEGNSWSDFPRFGFNADAVVFTFNMFDASTFPPKATNTQILSIAKSSIGQPKLTTVRVDKSADFTDTPASMHGAQPGGPMYFVESTANFSGASLSSYHIMTWSNPLSAQSASSDNELPVSTYYFPFPAEQKGGQDVDVLDTNDVRVLSVAWRDNRLVAANTSAVDASGVAKVHWYEFQTDASSPTNIPLLTQSGIIDPGSGVSTFFPAIDINKAGDLGLTYMESSANEYVSMYVTGQVKGDPAGIMRPSVLAQAGVAPYVAFDGPPYRQGDFAGMGVDPVDDSFWSANEYAIAPQPGANYSTWIQQFTVRSAPSTGNLNLGNSLDGIHLTGVTNVMIGGPLANMGNVISANGGNGIYSDSTSSFVTIQSNSIGTDLSGTANLGNVANGIDILSTPATIGGETIAGENVIAFNGAAGVLVGGSGTPSYGTQDSILVNSIHNNGGLGISLGNGFTPTPNQPGGGSLPGPNNLQNFPALTAAIVDTPTNKTEIQGSLSQVPNGVYTVDFYSSPVGDPTGHGQGTTFLAQTTVIVASNSGTIDYMLPKALPSGLYISATATGPTGNTSEFSATVQTQARVALGITGKATSTSQPHTYPGDTLTYTFTVTNSGTNPASQVVLTDTLDPNTTFESSTATSYSISGSTVTVTLGTLAGNGATTTVTITVLVGPGNRGAFSLSNAASVSTFDFNTSAPSQVTVPTSVLPSADLAVASVTASKPPIYPTGNLTYTIVVTNNGPSNSSGGKVTDSIPGLTTGDVTFVSSSTGDMPSGSGIITFGLPPLNSGASQIFTVTVSPTAKAVTKQLLPNTATVTGTDHDPNLNNNTGSSQPITVTPAIDLNATLTGSAGTVQVGDPLSYTATVTNTSGVDATGVTLVDTLPANVVVVSAPNGATINGNTLTYTIGSLPHGQTSAPVVIVVSPTAAALSLPTITSTVNFTSNEVVLNPTGAQASVTTNVIDQQGILAFASASYVVPETAGSATLTVVRTGGKRGALTVQYNTVPVNAGPGTDYTSVSGTLTFPDGVTSQSIVVPVLANPFDRTNELVDVVLSKIAPSGGVLGSPSTATLTIVDTDPHTTPPVVSGLSWNGTSTGISSIQVGFSVPLLQSSALNSANYTLISLGPDERLGTADDKIVPVTPSYDASSFVVTLTPDQPLAANQFYRLVVSAAAPGGVQDRGGLLLAGNGVTAGTNYAASLATGTNLKYFTPLGDMVSITIAGGGYLNDQLDGSGQGKNLTVVSEVPHHTVLTGTVTKGHNGTGRAYLGPTIFGLGKFNDVTVKMYSPPFQVDYYPFSPGSQAAQTASETVRLDGVVMSPAHKVVAGALTHSARKARVARPRVHVTRSVRVASAHPALQSLKASAFQAKKKDVPSYPTF